MSDRVFNNADSFSMAFDEMWKSMQLEKSEKSVEEKISSVISCLNDHPFFINQPEEAKKVALFRVKLLDLN